MARNPGEFHHPSAFGVKAKEKGERPNGAPPALRGQTRPPKPSYPARLNAASAFTRSARYARFDLGAAEMEAEGTFAQVALRDTSIGMLESL